MGVRVLEGIDGALRLGEGALVLAHFRVKLAFKISSVRHQVVVLQRTLFVHKDSLVILSFLELDRQKLLGQFVTGSELQVA